VLSSHAVDPVIIDCYSSSLHVHMQAHHLIGVLFGRQSEGKLGRCELLVEDNGKRGGRWEYYWEARGT